MRQRTYGSCLIARLCCTPEPNLTYHKNVENNYVLWKLMSSPQFGKIPYLSKSFHIDISREKKKLLCERVQKKNQPKTKNQPPLYLIHIGK